MAPFKGLPGLAASRGWSGLAWVEAIESSEEPGAVVSGRPHYTIKLFPCELYIQSYIIYICIARCVYICIYDIVYGGGCSVCLLKRQP